MDLLAQAGEIAPGPATGWFVAGMNMLVLAWYLLKRTPDHDRQISALIKAKDEAISEAMETFKSEMIAERLACAKNFEMIAARIDARGSRR